MRSSQAPRQARSQALSTWPRWPHRRDDRGTRGPLRQPVEFRPAALSGMFPRAEVTYAWPRDDSKVGSDREPVALFTPLGVPALAQADANTKVASRTLRAGHDDTVSGLRRGRPRDGDFGQQHAHFRVLPPQARAQTQISYTSRAQFPPCGNGFPRRPVTNCHLELSTSKSRPFCRHIAYLFARRSNGVPEIMPRALNKTVKGTKSAKPVKARRHVASSSHGRKKTYAR